MRDKEAALHRIEVCREAIYGRDPLDLEARREHLRAVRACECVLAREDGGTYFVGSLLREYDGMIRLKPLATTCRLLVACGPQSTGRELCTSVLHSLSTRSGRPIRTVTAKKLERLVLGQGAAADASFLEGATGGTLVVTGLEATTPVVQGALITLVESRNLEFASGVRLTDVRFLGTATPALEVNASAGRFRRDLFELMTLLHTIPLAERTRDHGLIADFAYNMAAPRLPRHGGPFRLAPADLVAKVSGQQLRDFDALQRAVERRLDRTQGQRAPRCLTGAPDKVGIREPKEDASALAKRVEILTALRVLGPIKPGRRSFRENSAKFLRCLQHLVMLLREAGLPQYVYRVDVTFIWPAFSDRSALRWLRGVGCRPLDRGRGARWEVPER